MHRDRVFGAAMLVVAATYYLIAGAIPQTTLADAVGPQGLPRIYAVVLAALAAILIGRRPAPVPEPAERRRVGRAAGMILLGVVYVAIVPWLGYLLSLAALIAATAAYQGGSLDRRTALVAAAGAVCFWVLFVVLLGIPQPAGVWPLRF